METYKAFISYRHLPLDRAVAVRLHRMLERYIIPVQYRAQRNQKHLGRVFRDEEELRLTSNLSETIRRTLDHTEYLIVLCLRRPSTPRG